MYVKHERCIFGRSGELLRMRTENSDLIMQKENQVIQIIFGHKSFQVVYRFKRLGEK